MGRSKHFGRVSGSPDEATELIQDFEWRLLSACIKLEEQLAVLLVLTRPHQQPTEEAARKAAYVIQDIVTVLSGDGNIAITRMRVSMSWTGRDGKENSVQTRTMELLRKQPDGTWRFIIDSPVPEMI